MKQLIPKMDKVMYIGDETYICQQNDYDLSEIIREKVPGLDYPVLECEGHPDGQPFQYTEPRESHTTGSSFHPGCTKSSPHDNIARNNSHQVISTAPIPLFSLKGHRY